jgi:trimethylamine:corrinoid methyltransferase-like protein
VSFDLHDQMIEREITSMNMTRIEPLFDQKAKDKIFNAALKVLKEIGIQCDHKKTIEILGQKTKIAYRNGRIHLDEDCMMEHLNAKRESGRKDDQEFRLVAPWCSFEINDPYTNEIRPAHEFEVVRAARLIDSLTVGRGPFGGPTPLYVGNIPARMATMKAEQIAVTYTRNLGGKLTATDRREIELISEMYLIAGRRYQIALQGLISPLKLNSELLDTFFEQDGKKDIDIEISMSIPMAGATAPLAFPASLIQSLAETMATDFIFNTLSDRQFDVLTVRLEPFDMKSNNIVFGSPEWCILNRAAVEIENELRGYPRRHGVFRSNSKRLDAQSMCERSMTVLWQALNGIRSFGAVGQLCVDEVFSPLQAVLDKQILLYVQRAVEDFRGCWNEDDDYLGILRDGISEGTFMGLDTTYENFRHFYSFSHFFNYANLNLWRQDGMKGIEDSTREEMEQIIGNHHFELDDKQKAEIDRLYRDGERIFANGG